MVTLRRLGPSLLAVGFSLAAARFVVSGFMPAWRSLNGDFLLAFPAPAVIWMRPDFPPAALAGPGSWNYGPMMHLVVTLPLLFAPSWSAVPRLWSAANLLFILLAFFLAVDLTGLRAKLSRSVIALLATVWLAYQPLAVCFAQSNIELSEFAAVLAGLALIERRRHRLGGGVLGFAAMIKFLPIGFLGWLALRRRWREFAVGMAVVAVIVVIAQLTLDWRHSLTLTSIVKNAANSAAYGMHDMSVTSTFLHWTSAIDWQVGTLRWFPEARHPLAARAGTLASLTFVAAYGLLFLRRGRKPIAFEEIGVLFLLMFLLPPWNHEDFFIFALVPITGLLVRALLEHDRVLLALTLVAYLLISPPVPYSLMNRSGWFPYSFAYFWNYHNMPFYGVLVLLVLATSRLLTVPLEANR